jgi:hypothetical protein
VYLIRRKSFIWVLFLSLALQGCAGIYSIVEFEVLEPATVSFPESVHQLVFLNRAPLTINNWSELNQVDLSASELVLLDTLVVNNLFRGVLDVLRNSPAKRFQMPIWLSERRSDTANLSDRILTKREVDNICDTIGGDAIISLELYFAAIDQHFDYYSDAPDLLQNQYFVVSNRVIWNIHLPQSPRPFDTYTTVDTLYFPLIENGTFTEYVPGANMIRDLFYLSGYKYGSYLVPAWNKTSRIIYRGRGESLRQAVKLTDTGDWEGALSIWDQLTASDDSTLVAKAFHNMAVYFEMEDNLDSASFLLDCSLAHDTLDSDMMYREELDVRLLNRIDIEKQVK